MAFMEGDVLHFVT